MQTSVTIVERDEDDIVEGFQIAEQARLYAVERRQITGRLSGKTDAPHMPVLVTARVDDEREALRRRPDELNDVTCHRRQATLLTRVESANEEVHAPLPSAEKGYMPSVR